MDELSKTLNEKCAILSKIKLKIIYCFKKNKIYLFVNLSKKT